ncbi:MAG: tRNA pseudouridine(13) synthase TruD [Planctomycetes bacterium]|nr:tRNA pseudouridine(13) synthase TruD [Planctomycetota bacterium]
MTEAPVWPLLCAELPRLPGRYKERPDDFRVTELPAYEACGEGEHVLFEVEKRGISTHEALARLGRTLGLEPRAIGIAGLKDAQGVTRQWLSVQALSGSGLDPERLLALELKGIAVRAAARHRNKLRVGHLRGNRFELRLRGVGANELAGARALLDVLARRGVPNYFGEQRFGLRGDTWKVGRALLLGEHEEAVAWIAGRAGAHDRGRIREARERYDRGDYLGAADAWPGNFRPCIRLCRAMGKSGGNARRALYALDRSFLRFYTSAYQSWLFNRVVALRLAQLDTVEEGDLAWLHRNGAVFLVKDLELDRERAARLEISASGPLFGTRMSAPAGRPLEVEQAVLAEAGHAAEAFAHHGPLQWQGSRRPLRFPLGEASCEAGRDEHGEFLELRFSLPPGCYATSVLRELLETPASDDDASAADSPVAGDADSADAQA